MNESSLAFKMKIISYYTYSYNYYFIIITIFIITIIIIALNQPIILKSITVLIFSVFCFNCIRPFRFFYSVCLLSP